jgi:Fur family transcriptional regulator, stress-responsive regulator
VSEPLLERIRARGWRVTPQRRAIAAAFDGEHVHLTAHEIHERARGVLPEVSLATVYNTLTELVAAGEIEEVTFLPGPARYDPNVGPGTHHHVLCTNCGTLFDVHPDGVDGLALPAAERHGVDVDTVSVLFRGTCRDCRAAGHEEPAAQGRTR